MSKRVALFLDYENFYTTLRKRQPHEGYAFQRTPRINFEHLVKFIEQKFGLLVPEDFIVVANFAHFDRQKGGLNRLATLVNVDSFKHRLERQQQQSTPGKRYVQEDFADMRLAYEIGKHATQNPADLYILSSGDGAFVAVGDALRAANREVVFLFSDPMSAAMRIKEEFQWLDVIRTKSVFEEADDDDLDTTPTLVMHIAEDVKQLCAVISELRREFSSPVPLALVSAIFGPTTITPLLNKAHGQGRLDMWEDPNGIRCVSLREEWMRGQVRQMQARPEIVARAQLLEHIARVSTVGLAEPTEAQWRRALSNQTPLSVRDAKQLMKVLFDMRILQVGKLQHATITLDLARKFLHHPDIPLGHLAAASPTPTP